MRAMSSSRSCARAPSLARACPTNTEYHVFVGNFVANFVENRRNRQSFRQSSGKTGFWDKLRLEPFAAAVHLTGKIEASHGRIEQAALQTRWKKDVAQPRLDGALEQLDQAPLQQ